MFWLRYDNESIEDMLKAHDNSSFESIQDAIDCGDSNIPDGLNRMNYSVLDKNFKEVYRKTYKPVGVFTN